MAYSKYMEINDDSFWKFWPRFQSILRGNAFILIIEIPVYLIVLAVVKALFDTSVSYSVWIYTCIAALVLCDAIDAVILTVASIQQQKIQPTGALLTVVTILLLSTAIVGVSFAAGLRGRDATLFIVTFGIVKAAEIIWESRGATFSNEEIVEKNRQMKDMTHEVFKEELDRHEKKPTFKIYHMHHK